MEIYGNKYKKALKNKQIKLILWGVYEKTGCKSKIN